MANELEIIYSTHNNFWMTGWSLHWLYAYTSIPFKLVVIDDSEDLTPTNIYHLRQEHDNIEMFRPKEPFTTANQMINFGLKHTKGDIVCFMANSIEVRAGWIEFAIQWMQNHDDIGVMGFKLLKPTRVVEHAGIHFEDGMPHHMNYGVGAFPEEHVYIREMEGKDSVGWALILLRRNAIPKGGLNEDEYIGFKGYDDIDNCLTIKQNGWKIVYFGFGCAVHYALTTRGQRDTEQDENDYETNRLTFLKKWGIPVENVRIHSGDSPYVA